MIFEYTTQSGMIADCELFIDQVGGEPALLFVQAPTSHPISNEISTLVEKALELHFNHVRSKQVDVRVFEHYPSKNVRKQVCTEVKLNIKRIGAIKRFFGSKKKWKVYNPQRREISHSSAVYLSLMSILNTHTGHCGYMGRRPRLAAATLLSGEVF